MMVDSPSSSATGTEVREGVSEGKADGVLEAWTGAVLVGLIKEPAEGRGGVRVSGAGESGEQAASAQTVRAGNRQPVADLFPDPDVLGKRVG